MHPFKCCLSYVKQLPLSSKCDYWQSIQLNSEMMSLSLINECNAKLVIENSLLSQLIRRNCCLCSQSLGGKNGSDNSATDVSGMCNYHQQLNRKDSRSCRSKGINQRLQSPDDVLLNEDILKRADRVFHAILKLENY
ncbi:hypothetical protein GJ496_005337 [Pomphorhynchus laevis]|nr:hypothetical protein GJ496_005337 [Pomphorhynchus laevis]